MLKDEINHKLPTVTMDEQAMVTLLEQTYMSSEPVISCRQATKHFYSFLDCGKQLFLTLSKN